ncbi:histidine kinase dimerization/phospho-acceptor domain-containing protein [Alteromonas abrolhosensis]|uniref:histidine kinase dimerization/phospho-acceptor domain-containing protein n=1 Tax=Alteromonas abrolhosensis TaxID=1892904 RepID=UPI00096B6CE0|nr:histidine kinase dimerization/phospho-acceptor domain-containing protein [Alteromonas abrolhosensis]
MSLRLKLIAIIAPVFFVLWLTASYFSITQLKSEINQAMDSRLASTARMMNNLMLSDQNSVGNLGLSPNGTFNDAGTLKGLACKISALNGEIIANSHPQELTLPNTLPSGLDTVIVENIEWRVFSLKTEKHTISIAEKLSERHAIFVQMVIVSALPTLISLVVSALVIWFALGRELRPLQRLKDAITNRSPNDLNPIRLRHNLQEITPLIDSQNQLFTKLENAIEREKAFTDNAAHELRTPLTGIISQLQVAKVTQGETRQRAIEKSLFSASRLQSLLENLLLLARIDKAPIEQHVQPWELSKELNNLLTELSCENSDIQVHTNASKRLSHIPVFAFTIVMKNLIDNARQHGVKGMPISIVIEEDDNVFVIRVSNHATLKTETLAYMTRRFWRESHSQGNGLGLAIVNALVEALNGTFNVNYEGDQLHVMITFPTSPNTE